MAGSTRLIWTKAERPVAVLALAHGAGAPMDSPFMDGIAARLAGRGVSVARFEFAYMAARRDGGKRKPPPKAERLVPEYAAAVGEIAGEGGAVPLLIGGKSLGGRVAAMASADPGLDVPVAGVVCLGYPFHPPADASKPRLAPLQGATVPVIVCQGDRDPFGNSKEVDGYDLPPTVRFVWLDDGDHDFKPRGRAEATWKGNLDAAADAVAAFAAGL